MITDVVHRITAPQPPSPSTDAPRPVIRKLGFARATTNPSNQLMVLRSSRSSTTAVAIGAPTPTRDFDARQGREACTKRTLCVSMECVRQHEGDPAAMEVLTFHG